MPELPDLEYCATCGFTSKILHGGDWDTCPNCDNFDWLPIGTRNPKHWTTQPPTEPGFFWAWTRDGRECVVHAVLNPDGLHFYETGNGWNYSVSDFTHFIGPLPVPEPPEKAG